MPPLVHGHDLDTAEQIVKGAQSTREDEDMKTQWRGAADASAQAFGEPEALGREVSLSRGPTPCPQYLDEMIFDLVVHGWDSRQGHQLPGPHPGLARRTRLRGDQAHG